MFSIDSIEKANQTLIATIQESIQITEEGRKQRQEAETRLIACETALKETLASAAGK